MGVDCKWVFGGPGKGGACARGRVEGNLVCREWERVEGKWVTWERGSVGAWERGSVGAWERVEGSRGAGSRVGARVTGEARHSGRGRVWGAPVAR